MDVKAILNHYNLFVSGYDNVSMVCPFHSENDPSLGVNVNTGQAYCFGCSWKGDIIDLVAKLENVNRLQALRVISSINGSSSQKFVANNGKKKFTNNKELLRKAYIEYRKALLPDWTMKNYLTDRGVNAETLNRFGVRYTMNGEPKFLIPIRDNGKFCGYIKTAKNQEPKYLYSRGFKRSAVLMGNYSKGIVFVTEGVIDYLRAWQFGEDNVVCLLGWKASERQLDKLRAVTDKVICALDNDKKGREGMQYLKKHFKVIEFPYPKGVKDIGEIGKKDFDAGMKKVRRR